MSLLCVQCGKVIVQSNNLDHYANCSRCDITKLTPEQKAKIERFFGVK
jgi:DNA-directed RNA polymerase subunit RPC12/RpoP